MRKRILFLPVIVTAISFTLLLPNAIAQTQQPQVTIKYYSNLATGIGYWTAPPSQGYLVLNLQITNINYAGYNQGFYVNPAAFHVIISNVEYDFDSATFSLQNPLPEATVLPGGTLTGAVAFLVPALYSAPAFQPTYQFAGATPAINWESIAPAPEFNWSTILMAVVITLAVITLRRKSV